MRGRSARSAFRRTMTLLATGNPLAEVLDAVALSVEAEAPGALCSILLLDETGRRLTLGAGSSPRATAARSPQRPGGRWRSARFRAIARASSRRRSAILP